MQFLITDNFLIISELFTLILLIYIFGIQLISHGVLKVKINAYTFTNSLGLLTLLSLIIQFILINFKLNLSCSIFNYCIEINTITNFLTYFLIIITIICLIFIIKINFLNFQYILKMEVYYLLILCITGGVFIIISNDLLILFLALELYNFGLYSILGLQQNRIINTEISVKYYLLSAISSSFILFGISIIYGFSGILNFNELSLFLISSTQFNYTLTFGFALVLIGIFVKLGAAPFHFWTPDIYEGSPNIITLILLTIPKLILIGLLLKLVFEVFFFFTNISALFMYILIFCSFYFGTFGAIYQIKIKKFLTYSGISNLGLCLLRFWF